MTTECCRDFLLFILLQIKIIISTKTAAVAMNRITKIDEAKVAAKMIVLSCNVELMLEVSIVVVTIEANDEFDPELLVGFAVTVNSVWPTYKNRQRYHFK